MQQHNDMLGFLETLRKYFDAALANGFTSKEAMEMTLHYQGQLMAAMLWQNQQKSDKPWERD